MVNVTPLEAFNTALDLFSTVIMLVLLVCFVQYKEYVKRKSDWIMFLIIVVNLVITFSDAMTWWLLEKSGVLLAFKIFLFIDYIFSNVIVILFHAYVIEYLLENVKVNKRYIYLAIPIVTIPSLVWIMSLWTEWFYEFGENGYVHGKYWIFCQIPGAFVILCDVILLLRKRRYIPKDEVSVWISYGMFGLLCVVLEMRFDIPFIYLAITLIVLIAYIQLNLKKNTVIVSQQAELAKKETEIANEKAKVVISQIKPHFLYNALTAIMAIEGNPVQTKKSLKNFANYMRGNLKLIDGKSLISFEDEIEHIKLYTSLEMLRFKDLKVEYDLKETSFQVPPLSVQILVENAILHGISKKIGGGTVIIKSYAENNLAVIEVVDDGLGFDEDVNGSSFLDGIDKSHVGLRNVRKRLEMIDGEFKISSKSGEGCKAVICIPIDR